MSFIKTYFDIEGSGETAVCCPFPHRTSNGIQYYEHNPSAHVNLDENVFHCKVCDVGYNDISFISKILDVKIGYAIRLNNLFNTAEYKSDWDTLETGQLSFELIEKANALGISTKVLNELNVKEINGNYKFPLFMYGRLLDIRDYNPNRGYPKVLSRGNSMAGLVMPYDIWRENKEQATVVCAGEKDMAVARTNGFNAITITGGENKKPICLSEFRGRDIIICYDNDRAGKIGAIRLANLLVDVANSVKVCTNFHNICKEDKEDLTDFFTKYNKTREDLISFIQATPYFEKTDLDIARKAKRMTLHEASKAENLNKIIRTNIQVVATSEATFTIPTSMYAEKMTSKRNDTERMDIGTIREWELTDKNVQHLLHLCDNNFKESDILRNSRDLMGIMLKEAGIKIRFTETATVYKSYVTDMFETSTNETIAMEFVAYSINKKLESGKKYLVDYKLVPHPYKGQQLTMLIVDVHQVSDSITNFKITQETKDNLDLFKYESGTLQNHITNLIERFKGVLGYNGNNDLITTIDLAYHTCLYFNFKGQSTRGYLDTVIVSESRVGKSSTAEAMRNLYGLGAITSLAGNSATVPGLVGGSNKTSSGFQTRAGIIPQNHKGLIIFEELGKSNLNLLAELTDIRSSNEVRIVRVAGTLTLPATVRMIMLSNVRTNNGNIRSIASYPNGIAILKELVKSAEDIARYDVALIISDRGNTVIDPNWKPATPYSEEAYQTRIRWIWSRTPEQIIISEDIEYYIIQTANKLSKTYDCHIKIFGTETWKKLTRLAIATAGYVVSTNDTYENIIIKKEHVDFAANFLIKIYDNPTFKLKEYVQAELAYSVIDNDGVKILENLYSKNPAMLLHLEQCNVTTKNTLQAVTGLSNDDYNGAMTVLTRGLFVRFSKYDIVPTERFRLGMGKINRAQSVPKLGLKL